MKGDEMTVHEAYRAFLEADNKWSAKLVELFGNKAGDVRYTKEGHTHPALAPLYEEFKRAGQVWREHMTSNGRTVS